MPLMRTFLYGERDCVTNVLILNVSFMTDEVGVLCPATLSARFMLARVCITTVWLRLQASQQPWRPALWTVQSLFKWLMVTAAFIRWWLDTGIFVLWGWRRSLEGKSFWYKGFCLSSSAWNYCQRNPGIPETAAIVVATGWDQCTNTKKMPM